MGRGRRKVWWKMKVFKIGVGLLLVTVAGLGLRGVLAGKDGGGNSGGNSEVVSVEVGREFEFGAMNDRGEKEGTVVLRVTKAEKTGEVLIKGKPARAKGEKAFLVLNLELDNASVEKRYLVPVDLIRLVGEGGRKFAPDVHSEVVEVQPISTKITRVGFVVKKKDRVFEIQVGELEGEKQKIEVVFSR